MEDDHHEREERFDAKRGAALTPAESQCGLGAASEAFLEAALFETEVLRERRRARVADKELSDPEDTAETGDLRWPDAVAISVSTTVVVLVVSAELMSMAGPALLAKVWCSLFEHLRCWLQLLC